MTQKQASQYRHLARVIDDFVDSHTKPDWKPAPDVSEYAWDDELVSVGHNDPVLDRVARECAGINLKYPAKARYCSDEGFQRLRELAQQLKDAADGLA